jgi:hypothetical protein
VSKNKKDEAYLRAFGQHIASLIQKKGYTSVYDFWIRRAGDKLSRASLNYIVTGQTDAKMLTLRTLAKLLKIDPKELLDFQV